jgi:Holliday junction resolvase
MDGSRYERRLKKKLEKEGYFVIRSAGSFTCDLIAVKDGKVYAYEVKSCKKKKYSPTPPEKEQIEKLKTLTKFGIIPVFIIWYKRRGWKEIDLSFYNLNNEKI